MECSQCCKGPTLQHHSRGGVVCYILAVVGMLIVLFSFVIPVAKIWYLLIPALITMTCVGTYCIQCGWCGAYLYWNQDISRTDGIKAHHRQHAPEGLGESGRWATVEGGLHVLLWPSTWRNAEEPLTAALPQRVPQPLVDAGLERSEILEIMRGLEAIRRKYRRSGCDQVRSPLWFSIIHPSFSPTISLSLSPTISLSQIRDFYCLVSSCVCGCCCCAPLGCLSLHDDLCEMEMVAFVTSLNQERFDGVRFGLGALNSSMWWLEISLGAVRPDPEAPPPNEAAAPPEYSEALPPSYSSVARETWHRATSLQRLPVSYSRERANVQAGEEAGLVL